MLRCLSVGLSPAELADAVRMNGISKSFGGIHALKDVDFNVRYGEIHALLGENGAGKSTLLKILRGVEAADCGAMEIHGRPVPVNRSAVAPRRGVAMIFQELSLTPTLTVAQNIFLTREPRNRFGLLDDDVAAERARQLFEDFGVHVDPEVRVQELGAGQRQLTEIVKAISEQSRILVLDEPTSALSGVEVDRLFAVLRRLKADGVAIVYVSHRMDEIMRIADRATVMREGRRVITAPVADLTLEMIIECIIGRQSAGFSQALRETEQRFRQLAENIREVFWMLDPKTHQVLYVSPAFEQIWGRSRETVYADPRSFLETVDDEDRPKVAAVYDQALGGQALLEHEYRILRPDGSLRWIRDRGFPIRDDAGEMYRLARITEDITDRKRVEAELQHSFAELRALAGRLQSVREEERTRVAREIHDELGQALTAIKIEFSSLVHNLPDGSRERSRSESILGLIDTTIQAVRRISTELRPGILDDLGLVAAVEWASEQFQARTGVRCHLDLPDGEVTLDRERTTALFRIFQETLTNVARHAQATQLHIRLAEDDGTLQLEVRDNGRGLDCDLLSSGRSLGIVGMRERAVLLGGELTLAGTPGQGTTVTARIPRAAGQESERK